MWASRSTIAPTIKVIGAPTLVKPMKLYPPSRMLKVLLTHN